MMRKLILLFIIIFAGCSSQPPLIRSGYIKSPDSTAEVEINSYWIQNGCTLYHGKFQKITFPGFFCLFLDDGSFISATDKHIRRFSPSKEVLWEIPGHFHHQVNISPDKKRILALSSDVIVRFGKKVRDDAFMILDLDGKVLHRQNGFEHVRKLNQGSLNWANPHIVRAAGTDIESTHFNSIYEIPPNSSTLPYLQAGNVIVNSSALGIYILSPDLKKVLRHEKFEFSYYHQVHDVQVTAEGEYFLFNNLANKRGEILYSAIQKYDPVTRQLTINFTAEPKGMFYSPACGAVQEIGDIIFFSHLVTGGYYFSKKKNEIIATAPGTNGNVLLMEPVQQLKLIEVDKFLKNSGN